ncbi:MAG: DUF349 domain-containing protein [Gammaproteobacteria bacterium]|nr:DUF349 domain-containing protein [Gammaproteobacteria bacterium]
MNIFSRFLTPKWKHKKLEVRKQAVLELIPGKKESQIIYSQVAQNDPGSELRIIAVRRLRFIDVVQKVANDGHDSRVKSVASRRLHQLLTGENVDIEACFEIIQKTTDEKLLEHVAKSSSQLKLKQAALDRIERQAFLGDLAINDDNASIRMAALQKIMQRSTLARVAKKSRTTDKKISTLAKERVAVLVAEEERPERLKAEAKQCAKDLSLLIQVNKKNREWQQTKSRYESLLSTWHGLEAEWSDAKNYGVWNEQLDERFTELCNEYASSLAIQNEKEAEKRAYEAEHAPMRAVIVELCETLETIASDYSGKSSPEPDDAKVIEQYLRSANIQWKELQNKAPEDVALYSARFEQVCEKLNIYQKGIELHTESKYKALNLLENISTENNNQHLNIRNIKSLEKRWSELPRPLDYKLERSLIDLVTAGFQTLHEKFKQQETECKESALLFESLVIEIGTTLDNGEVRHAAKLVNQGRKILEKIPEKSLKLLVDHDKKQRFQRYSAELNELKNWHDWSSLPVKERLCQEMEQLAVEVEKNQENPDYDLGEVARLVKVARDEWKTTGASDDKKFWERFNDACHRAYEPCKGYFNAQSQQREQSLKQKEAVCEGLEKYADLQKIQVEQGSIDWAAAEKIIRAAQQEWHEAGFVDRKYLKTINSRFRKVMNQLRRATKNNRIENKNKKLELIKQSEDVRTKLNEEEIDIQQAILQIKQIQAVWKIVGNALDDRALWKDLRVICDDIFDRRDEKNEAAHQEQLNNLTAKEILCDEISSLAKNDVELIQVEVEKFQDLKDKWQQLGAVPKKEFKSSSQRFESVCEQFEVNYNNYIKNQKKIKKEQLKLKHKICSDLEKLLGEVVSANIEKADLEDKILAIDEQWNALESQSSAIDAAIVMRYENTKSSLDRHKVGEDITADIDAYCQSNQLAKEKLCLRLEVLAGVPSPEEVKLERMQYQVAILADEMKNSEPKDKNSTRLEIEHSWYAVGLVPDELNRQLEKRFFTVLENF